MVSVSASQIAMLPTMLRKAKSPKHIVPVVCLCIASTLIFASVLRNMKSYPIEITKVMSLAIEESPIPAKTQRFLFSGMPGMAGGLGNKLFELCSHVGISRSLNRTAAINVFEESYVKKLVAMHDNFPKLVEQFEFKLIPDEKLHKSSLGNSGCCKYEDPKKFENDTHDHLLLYGYYRQSFKYFETMKTEVLDWLTPTKNDTETAKQLVPKNLLNDYKVCVHIRRGDFATDGLHEPSHPVFARLATDYLVAKHKSKNQTQNVTVFLMSNDAHFSHAVFEDRVLSLGSKQISNQSTEYKKKLVITYPVNSPNYTALLINKTVPFVDLALSRLFCDSVLITAPSSTFGWWLGFLAKPTSTVYYRNIAETQDKVIREMNQEDFYPAHWTRLGTNPKGEIVQR